MQYFERMVRKTSYSYFLCLRNKKLKNFQIFPTLPKKNAKIQQKLWYLAKNVVVIVAEQSEVSLCTIWSGLNKK